MSSEAQRDIRFAAETIYRNAHRSPLLLTRSHHTQLDLLSFINEDYIAGYTQDGQMSTVRRFFCLFVVFDLFFISMLWFICIMMNGDTILNALKVQVVHYTIQSSLFDIIFAAFVRFLLLVVFYGVFAINHWSIIVFTTTASCAFLIGKVFYYNWMVSAQPIIQVLMIIVSCLLAWGEAWFLDCRVIPQEKNAQRFYRLLMSQTDDNERSPLLESYLNTIHNVGHTDSSVANFYSPIESVHNSDSEGDEDDLYRNKAIADVHAALELLDCIDWKVEKIITSTGDKIQSIQRKKFGKIYRLTAQMNLPAKTLLHKLYYGIDGIPTWNPTVLEARILKKIDNHTDITYSVSAPGGGGLVDSRDFINLRSWQLIKNGNIIEDIDIFNDNRPDKDSPHKSNETVQPMKKSTSEINLMENQQQGSDLDQSVYSLSKSLGAKVFSDDECLSPAPEMFSSKSTTDDADEFVDANETQGAESTNDLSHRSEAVDHIKNITKDLCDRMYIVSGVSIKYDQMPAVSKYTRGETLMGCWAMRESKSDPNTCTFEWIMCLDLKGRFPRFVLDKAYTGVMQEFMSHLRKYCESSEAAA
ncbi:steroidogenic acute regulatory protein-like [Sitodiplosis mosellana]|uniref:steroidogenic acute regulatory protein-like n=1 Tax=Sitodiplosis mosellana TaxID=263140 RepID=UPI0024445796|nr:steroidogenic acute regulatory protein-like [Sitodiplosis mosellana]XP_055303523.1 steroidogenic acute regulatory protein-like [Sitodiplosis mosellana]XP_055303525.1 steroidogenic acute regulatory protein-like [Sitodiplosis mosellana]XP_055303526.1 steroidogenic acute regulatory protein-like [Sitodiplosis mosellana]